MSHSERNIRVVLMLVCVLGNVPFVLGQTAESLLLKPEASRAENIGAYKPNSQGVYPVRIRWESDGASRSYHVYRSVNPDSAFERISAQPVQGTGGLIVFIDENPAAVPGKPYYYRVSLSTSADSPSSGTVMGYGALTHERFLREYAKTLASSHQKLTYMHKPGNTSKLGSEQKSGAISGSLAYNARVSGLGGRVTMVYDRYADFYMNNNSALGPYFILTGSMNTTANMSQNGTMDGTIRVSGMYSGQVHYDKILIKNGTAGGGTYGVEPEGFPRVELNWDIIN